MKSFKVVAVVLCAGSGSRANLGYNKILHDLSGVSVARRSVEKFLHCDRVIVVCAKDDEELLRSQLPYDNIEFDLGGNTRTQSVRNALAVIDSADIVVIHDGARPFVSPKIIEACINSAINSGSGVATVKSINSVKIEIDDKIKTVNRDSVYSVQTPQAFKFEQIFSAYRSVEGDYADDSEIYEIAGFTPTLVEGDYANIKLTTPSDFIGLNGGYKLGYGFDVHRFIQNRPLILCGEKIAHPLGLDGHSDADAPVHAIIDAILSCLGFADIGVLFPDTDPTLKDANSMDLLKKVVALSDGYIIESVSVCIITQKPKLAPHIKKMRANISCALSIPIEKVNISATTSELLGITGDGRGLASSADVLMRKK